MKIFALNFKAMSARGVDKWTSLPAEIHSLVVFEWRNYTVVSGLVCQTFFIAWTSLKTNMLYVNSYFFLASSVSDCGLFNDLSWEVILDSLMKKASQLFFLAQHRSSIVWYLFVPVLFIHLIIQAVANDIVDETSVVFLKRYLKLLMFSKMFFRCGCCKFNFQQSV